MVNRKIYELISWANRLLGEKNPNNKMVLYRPKVEIQCLSLLVYYLSSPLLRSCSKLDSFDLSI